ncbi:MAG: methyltransferase domain-containing protein [Clostridia bacterium]|nr:methyltransferase domain-containing protein [Clostridia bacterium]
MTDERYYSEFALAAIRGQLERCGKLNLLPPALRQKPISELTEADVASAYEVAKKNGIKIYDFKRTHRDMPRVQRVLGILKGLCPSSLLDVGSGRGVFLLPFLDEFPDAQVAVLEILASRVQLWEDIVRGGVARVSVKAADVCTAPYPPNSFDAVTMLEVLEHIPDYRGAIAAAVSMARKYVVATVPSREDDNPEHIHLLTKECLQEAFSAAGASHCTFGGVPGHLIVIAGKEAL